MRAVRIFVPRDAAARSMGADETARAILDEAKEWGAELIVVGSHDRSRVERFLMGSIAESVVKHAPCSVLVLKHAAGV